MHHQVRHSWVRHAHPLFLPDSSPFTPVLKSCAQVCCARNPDVQPELQSDRGHLGYWSHRIHLAVWSSSILRGEAGTCRCHCETRRLLCCGLSHGASARTRQPRAVSLHFPVRITALRLTPLTNVFHHSHPPPPPSRHPILHPYLAPWFGSRWIYRRSYTAASGVETTVSSPRTGT